MFFCPTTPWWGKGSGGILYTIRGSTPSYTHYNNRGDVVAKTNASGALTYEAAYEAYGKRTAETGSTDDRQKANTKDEDPTGLLNEGFRYRDLETGTFITRDPLMFVDGPNMYAYVVQNPWSKFDPEGLKVKVETKKKKNDKGDEVQHTKVTVSGKVRFHGDSAKLSKEEQEKVVARIESGIKDRYKSESEKHTVEVDIKLKIAKSDKEIDPEDHVFHMVDSVEKERKSWYLATGEAHPFQKSIVIANSVIGPQTYAKNGLEAVAAHEFGHTLGLKHPHPRDINNLTSERLGQGVDYGNDVSYSLSVDNIMRYFGERTVIDKDQLRYIQRQFDKGFGNQGSNLNTYSAVPNINQESP